MTVHEKAVGPFVRPTATRASAGPDARCSDLSRRHRPEADGGVEGQGEGDGHAGERASCRGLAFSTVPASGYRSGGAFASLAPRRSRIISWMYGFSLRLAYEPGKVTSERRALAFP